MLLLTPFLRKSALTLCLSLTALLAAGGIRSFAKTAVSKEYQVKAVFLFNFAQFVTWPRAAFAEPNEPFRIGVLGDDPFNAFLDETVRGEKANGHPLVVQRYSSVKDVKACQILFISRSESQRMEKILADLKGRTVLTVGDSEGFLKNGGVIRFVTEKKKIRFRINLEAAKSVNLSISSKMLRLAQIAEPGKD